MLRIAHIVNPVLVDNSRDLFEVQSITFETMNIARQFSNKIVKVDFFSAQFQEDRSEVPDYIQLTPDLTRSILDIDTFSEKRKLPLINDILNRLYEVSDAEYFIYTNVDIALMPYFYAAISNIIESGYDAFVITRRTIEKKYGDIGKLYLMFSQVGEDHRGHDCFVFKRDYYKNFKLGTSCIGADWIGKVLIANLIYSASHFHEFKNLHLTFHIGDDRLWKVSKFEDYNRHNAKVLHEVIKCNVDKGKFLEHPTILKFLKRLQDIYGDFDFIESIDIKKNRDPFYELSGIHQPINQILSDKISSIVSVWKHLKIAWRGFFISFCLFLYALSSLPGNRIFAYFCILPYVYDINLRYIRSVKHRIRTEFNHFK